MLITADVANTLPNPSYLQKGLDSCALRLLPPAGVDSRRGVVRSRERTPASWKATLRATATALTAIPVALPCHIVYALTFL